MPEWLRRAARPAACVLLAVVAGVGSAHYARATHVAKSDFAIRVGTPAGTSTTLGGKAAPFVYWTSTGVEHRLRNVVGTTTLGSVTSYRVSTDEPGHTAAVTVQRTSALVKISYVVAGAAVVGFAMTAGPNAHFLGTGQRLRWVDMSRTVQPLKVRNACGSSAPTPFFASTAGFGAWVSSTAVGRIAFPDAVDDPNFACDLGSPPCSVGRPTTSVRWCFSTDRVSMTIATGSLSKQLTAHARALGLPRKPWLPQFALIKWRDAVQGPADLYDDIQQLRSRDIPIGWVLLDNPWEQGATTSGCYGALAFGSAFPNPKAMIAAIHRRGIRFMLWVSPQIDRRVGCAAPGYPDGWLTGDDMTFVRDLTNPTERFDFTHRLTRLVALGVDGFKGDRGDEVNLEPDQLYGGPGTIEQNALPLLYDRAAAAAFAAAHRPAFASLFRAFVAGSSAALPGFVGPDAEQTFTGLTGEIRAAQTAGIAGATVWGSDVGGYAGGNLTPELFVRWAQFAALTPIFEVGGAGRNATFWQLGAAAVSGLRSAAMLHYELVPYLYSLAQAAHATGLPVIRPLGLTWPRDELAWQHDLEFTLGDALLAAPVIDDGSRSTPYLPTGIWVDLFTGARRNGGRTTSRTNTPGDFPLYLRTGHAIPDNFRSPSIWSQPWRTNDLLRADRQGWIVATKPGVAAHSTSQRAQLTARTDQTGRTEIVVTQALREEQVAVYSAGATCSVRVGNAVLRHADVRSIVPLASAWTTWKGAVVIKISQAAPTTKIRLVPC